MRKLFFGAALILLFTSVLFAQDPGKTRLLVGGGLSFPNQPEAFSRWWSMGFTAGCGMSHDLSPNLALVGQFDYNSFTLNEDQLLKDVGASSSGVTIDGGTASIVTVSANLKYSFAFEGNRVAPYFTGGIGFFSLSLGDVTLNGGGSSATLKGDSESALLFLVGTGMDIPAGERTELFIDVKYGIGFTENENTQYVPIKFGMMYRL